jgi:hypothetical protein
MRHLLIFFFIISIFPLSYSQSLTGRIISRASNEPLSYVTIGVLDKNYGTISDQDGFYKLNLNGLSSLDTVMVSMIGYKYKKFSVSEFALKNPNEIVLDEEIIELDELVISERSKKSIVKGSKGVSGFMETGWGGTTGGERSLKIDITKPVFIREINFHIASNEYDSVLLRFHIRKFGKKEPGDELLKENVFIKVYNENRKWVSRDLRQYQIVIDQDVIIGLELVSVWGRCKTDNCFHLSMDVPGKKFYFKLYGYSKWEVRNLRSPSINIDCVDDF